MEASRVAKKKRAKLAFECLYKDAEPNSCNEYVVYRDASPTEILLLLTKVTFETDTNMERESGRKAQLSNITAAKVEDDTRERCQALCLELVFWFRL